MFILKIFLITICSEYYFDLYISFNHLKLKQFTCVIYSGYNKSKIHSCCHYYLNI